MDAEAARLLPGPFDVALRPDTAVDEDALELDQIGRGDRPVAVQLGDRCLALVLAQERQRLLAEPLEPHARGESPEPTSTASPISSSKSVKTSRCLLRSMNGTRPRRRRRTESSIATVTSVHHASVWRSPMSTSSLATRGIVA